MIRPAPWPRSHLPCEKTSPLDDTDPSPIIDSQPTALQMQRLFCRSDHPFPGPGFLQKIRSPHIETTGRGLRKPCIAGARKIIFETKLQVVSPNVWHRFHKARWIPVYPAPFSCFIPPIYRIYPISLRKILWSAESKDRHAQSTLLSDRVPEHNKFPSIRSIRYF